jgi:hypothetical protein
VINQYKHNALLAIVILLLLILEIGRCPKTHAVVVTAETNAKLEQREIGRKEGKKDRYLQETKADSVGDAETQRVGFADPKKRLTDSPVRVS